MKLKRTVIAFLLSSSMLFMSAAPSFAAERRQAENAKGYIWDQSTGKVITYDPSTFQSAVTTSLTLNEKETENRSKPSIVTPDSLMPVFDHYSENSETLNWKQEYVGVTRVDNSKSSAPADIIFQAVSSGSFSISGTVGVETSTELNAILNKVKVTASISGTSSRSWSTGSTYGTKSVVPAGKIGKITAYIPGTASNGYAVYKVYNTTDDTYFIDNRPRGAIVPAQNAWNFVVEIPSA